MTTEDQNPKDFFGSSGTGPPPTDIWYRELFNRGHSLICIHDLNGILLAINPAAAEATGYLAEELVGKDMALLLPEETRSGFKRYLERINEKGTDTGMMKIVARDGNERVWMYRNTICDDDYGRYVLGNAQDATEIRNAMRLQQHVAQDFKDLVNNSEFGIYRSTPSGRFVMVNQALVEMLGYESQEELLKIQIGDLYYDPDQREEMLELAKTTERFRGLELEWLRKAGSRITVRLSGRVLYIPESDREPVFFEMFVEDVSERRAMESQLTKIQNLEVVGQLTGGMAHDFNNILTVIITNANLLRTALKPDDEVGLTDLDELESAARRGTA
ncbi:MAG: PAS domain S-box protein, partial [Gemmatimonadota bacterium]|nr:PAS domain S-box protein [Gemmatimonadota bacterium]